MIYKVKRFSSKEKRTENRKRDLERGKMECLKWNKTLKENYKYYVQNRQNSGKPEVTKEETLVHIGRVVRGLNNSGKER